MKKVTDKTFQIITLICAGAVFMLMLLIILHMVAESIPAFQDVGWGMFDIKGEWRPVSANPKFSLLPAISGTIYVSFLGVLFSLVFGIGCAFLLSFYIPKRVAAVLISFIDLVAGIPSVIFGFIGLTVLVKGFQVHLKMAAGQCALAAGIVLGIMLLPFVVSTCSESIMTARKKYESTALALGFSRETIIVKIIFPSIRTSMMAAMMMALGRGLGETMAVMMVVGNSAIYPSLFGRAQTIASLTALEMGSIEYGSTHLAVLYAANLILLILLAVVLLSAWMLKRRIERYE